MLKKVDEDNKENNQMSVSESEKCKEHTRETQQHCERNTNNESRLINLCTYSKIDFFFTR